MQTSSHQWSAGVTKAPLKLEEKVYRPPNEDLLLAEDSDDEAAAKVKCHCWAGVSDDARGVWWGHNHKLTPTKVAKYFQSPCLFHYAHNTDSGRVSKMFPLNLHAHTHCLSKTYICFHA
jgi:hypothetical protein